VGGDERPQIVGYVRVFRPNARHVDQAAGFVRGEKFGNGEFELFVDVEHGNDLRTRCYDLVNVSDA
jgi:hypothetical protein